MAVTSGIINHASGATLLTRAVELDQAGRFTESLVFYESGIEQLLVYLKSITEEDKRQHYRKKISEYMGRAEEIKDIVKKQKQAGKYHEQIKIEEGSTGYTYNKIFQPYMDSTLTEVHVEDPYIRSIHQIYNFLRFCELLVSSECAEVKKIHLTTGVAGGKDSHEKQKNSLSELAESLSKHGIQLDVVYSEILHDREISLYVHMRKIQYKKQPLLKLGLIGLEWKDNERRVLERTLVANRKWKGWISVESSLKGGAKFNNGWIIKIGRGLDIYKSAPSKFSIGYCDYNLRPCHETTVDIFHKKM